VKPDIFKKAQPTLPQRANSVFFEQAMRENINKLVRKRAELGSYMGDAY
jgi:hypothetical protein